MMTLHMLNVITGTTQFSDRKQGFLDTLNRIGGELNEPPIMAQILGQVLLECGAFRYVKEIWGPTKAQLGYEGRKDLGNIHPGDGKRFMGHSELQVTGRENHRVLGKWAGYDFEADPDALSNPKWLGYSTVWYFTVGRPKLLGYCREGNNEMVTRQVNGGLNHFKERLEWYDKAALVMLNQKSIREFQFEFGLAVDGISGPMTRARLHRELCDLT